MIIKVNKFYIWSLYVPIVSLLIFTVVTLIAALSSPILFVPVAMGVVLLGFNIFYIKYLKSIFFRFENDYIEYSIGKKHYNKILISDIVGVFPKGFEVRTRMDYEDEDGDRYHSYKKKLKFELRIDLANGSYTYVPLNGFTVIEKLTIYKTFSKYGFDIKKDFVDGNLRDLGNVLQRFGIKF